MNAPALALAAVVLLGGCSMSTSYVPKSDGRVKLTMETGQMSLTKGGRSYNEAEPFSTLVVCDEEARSLARSGESNLQSGRALIVRTRLGPPDSLISFG